MDIGSCIENACSTIIKPSKSFNFDSLESISLKILVHILLSVNAASPEDLEPIWCITNFPDKLLMSYDGKEHIVEFYVFILSAQGNQIQTNKH